jgi:integrase
MNHRDHAYHAVTRTIGALNRKRRQAGLREIPSFNIRLLRHWFISWALNRPDNPLTETQLIKIVGHADFEMIGNTYYHLDVEGESGRKMRETRLFSTIGDTNAITVRATGKQAPLPRPRGTMPAPA